MATKQTQHIPTPDDAREVYARVDDTDSVEVVFVGYNGQETPVRVRLTESRPGTRAAA